MIRSTSIRQQTTTRSLPMTSQAPTTTSMWLFISTKHKLLRCKLAPATTTTTTTTTITIETIAATLTVIDHQHNLLTLVVDQSFHQKFVVIFVLLHNHSWLLKNQTILRAFVYERWTIRYVTHRWLQGNSSISNSYFDLWSSDDVRGYL